MLSRTFQCFHDTSRKNGCKTYYVDEGKGKWDERRTDGVCNFILISCGLASLE